MRSACSWGIAISLRQSPQDWLCAATPRARAELAGYREATVSLYAKRLTTAHYASRTGGGLAALGVRQTTHSHVFSRHPGHHSEPAATCRSPGHPPPQAPPHPWVTYAHRQTGTCQAL